MHCARSDSTIKINILGSNMRLRISPPPHCVMWRKQLDDVGRTLALWHNLREGLLGIPNWSSMLMGGEQTGLKWAFCKLKQTAGVRNRRNQHLWHLTNPFSQAIDKNQMLGAHVELIDIGCPAIGNSSVCWKQ